MTILRVSRAAAAGAASVWFAFCLMQNCFLFTNSSLNITNIHELESQQKEKIQLPFVTEASKELGIEVVDKVNTYRLSKNLPSIAWNDELYNVALNHALEGSAAGALSKEDMVKLLVDSKINSLNTVFNIAKVSAAIGKPSEAAFDEWVYKTDSLINIEGNFTSTAAAVVKEEDNYYVTQIFTD